MKENESKNHPQRSTRLSELLSSDLVKEGVVQTISKDELAEVEKLERRQIRTSRLERAHIPKRYRDASIERCPLPVRSFVEMFNEATGHGLVLFGEVGTGKTYAACAALIALADKATVRFATGSEILRDIRATYNNRSVSERDMMACYTGPRVLVVDDIGKEHATDWALSIMFDVLAKRDAACKPTIFTAQLGGDGIKRALSVHGDSATAEAIVSRMRSCVSVAFSGPDRRVR